MSSKQQEMEVKFELMKKTLNLLKKYNRFDVIDLEAKFNSTPVRWTNLKSKVTLAKQRLGPTIQEESKIIINVSSTTYKSNFYKKLFFLIKIQEDFTDVLNL